MTADAIPQRIRIGAYGVVIEADKMLLCHLTRSGRWTLPGGGLDFGEAPEAGMRREVLEETGMVVEPDRVLGVHSFTKHGPDEDFQSIQIVYSTILVGGMLRQELDGTTDDCAWVPIAGILDMDIVPLVGVTLSNFMQLL